MVTLVSKCAWVKSCSVKLQVLLLTQDSLQKANTPRITPSLVAPANQNNTLVVLALPRNLQRHVPQNSMQSQASISQSRLLGS